MTTSTGGSAAAGKLAFDAQNLEQLKLQAKNDPKAAIGAASRQFESLFLSMMLKSMREATPQGGLMDNEQTKLYTSLLDQQLAQQLSSRGTGLAQVMARQLSANLGSSEVADPASPSALDPAQPVLPGLTFTPVPLVPAPRTQMPARVMREPVAAVNIESPTPRRSATESLPGTAAAAPVAFGQTRDFANRMWSHAVDAARSIGVQPHFMIGQAALESGWGRHEIRTADGTPSHNVFGIKAGRNWKGPVVEKTTTEYVNGVAQKTTAKFRVYDSYADAFRDYANLLRNNPRYSQVVGQAGDAHGFARGLQQAGYATDPAYADKLVRVINGTTLRQSLAASAPPQVVAQR